MRTCWDTFSLTLKIHTTELLMKHSNYPTWVSVTPKTPKRVWFEISCVDVRTFCLKIRFIVSFFMYNHEQHITWTPGITFWAFYITKLRNFHTPCYGCNTAHVDRLRQWADPSSKSVSASRTTKKTKKLPHTDGDQRYNFYFYMKLYHVQMKTWETAFSLLLCATMLYFHTVHSVLLKEVLAIESWQSITSVE